MPSPQTIATWPWFSARIAPLNCPLIDLTIWPSTSSLALDELAGAIFFTILDLCSAYNLVHIREGNEWKTAFITPTGHYETLVMPFGLCNSPSAFQNLINDVLRDMLGHWVFAYLDDILVYSNTLLEHVQQIRAIL